MLGCKPTRTAGGLKRGKPSRGMTERDCESGSASGFHLGSTCLRKSDTASNEDGSIRWPPGSRRHTKYRSSPKHSQGAGRRPELAHDRPRIHDKTTQSVFPSVIPAIATLRDRAV